MAGTESVKGRVAILGAGREGQAAWRYLRRMHPGLPITLISESRPDPDFLAQLSGNDRVQTSPLSEAGLEKFDLLVRSPGISLYRDSLQKALGAGVGMTTPSKLWFAAHPDQKTICITGTKGKSTTSALLAHMLESSGYRVQLAGNIGLPLLSCKNGDVDWWVIELSSYQLADLEANPTVSAILNLSSEHLDWHGSEKKYHEDKLRLAELSGSRPLIANAADPVLRNALAGFGNTTWFNSADGFRVAGRNLYEGDVELHPELPDGLPGSHNLANVAAALTIFGALGEDPESGLRSIPSFRCLPHRLQHIGEKLGIQFVDDSISSTPVATAAALEAYSGRTVTLLLGGLDRGLDWAPYMGMIGEYLPLAIIGMPNNGSRIIREMKKAKISPQKGLHEAADLEKAVMLARDLTAPGGVVLLSPGAPSFPQFRDYSDRGRQFAKICGLHNPEGTEPSNEIK
jgi:UDP-N-acetylmuramoylalanine--D-glutamate ligase